MNDFETTVQNRLHRQITNYKNHIFGAPNVYLYSWESDYISITNSLFVHEFEIKKTLSDFRSDFKKIDKHNLLQLGHRKARPGEQRWPRTSMGHEYINGRIIEPRPNYFWYICEDGLIDVNDIPGYAGLMYCYNSRRGIEEIKKAPRIHKNKIREADLMRMNKNMYYRYWNLREKMDALQKEMK